jgi:hypothetical protein
MSTRTDHWVAPDDVRASIGEFIDAVDREPLTAKMPHATWEITRRGQQFRVECYGAGGGWYNGRDLSRRELLHYLDAQDELQLLRPESQRPD